MILCCGEALVDMLPGKTVGDEQAFVPCPGGAILNTAVALGRLGAPAAFFGGLSSDFMGDLLRDTLEASHVATSSACVSDRPTTLAFVRLVDGQARYAFYDEGTAGRMLDADALPRLRPETGAMLFGGISLIAEPCGSAFEALMAREHRSRAIMLDPNIRPSLIRDRDAHRARLMRMIAMSDIVKLSDEDLAWFGDGGAPDAARRFLDLGPQLVLVTRGRDGAIGYTRGATVEVPAGAVDIVDTVGAGDTFNAGVLCSLFESGRLSKRGIADLTGDAIAAAIELGNRAAAVTVSRAGANPPWRAELA